MEIKKDSPTIDRLSFSKGVNMFILERYYIILLIVVLSSSLPLISSASDQCNYLNSTIPENYIPLPPLEFVEEWDNGLMGNHPWVHDADTPGGTYITETQPTGDGVLYKENRRYSGETTAGYNKSEVLLQDGIYPGLLVTPFTEIEFKMDELYINEQPPSEPGSTTAWQGLWLNFSNDLLLQFSLEGQIVGWSDKTGYYTFTLGGDMTGNIYTLFQGADITITEPLFLESIEYYQQLWYLSSPSTEEHLQILEADYVRILLNLDELYAD